jgi:hypothetical protein
MSRPANATAPLAFLKQAIGRAEIAQEVRKHGNDVIAPRQGVRAAVESCRRCGKEDRIMADLSERLVRGTG